jgi:hypothetical protein
LASIAVIGSIACDEVVRLAAPLSAGAHLTGTRTAIRLGGGGANTAVAVAAAGHYTDAAQRRGRRRGRPMDSAGTSSTSVGETARAPADPAVITTLRNHSPATEAPRASGSRTPQVQATRSTPGCFTRVSGSLMR